MSRILNNISTIRELKDKITELKDRIASLKRHPKTRRKEIKKNEMNESLDMGNSQAELLCLEGDRYYNGHGVNQDYVRAKSCYEEAAQLESGRACKCLGRIYETGIGARKDLEKAYRWYKKGEDLGDPGCLYALGKYYEYNLVPEGEPNRGIEDAIAIYPVREVEVTERRFTRWGGWVLVASKRFTR